MRIAMIGAGAMGSLYGGLLKRAGNDVILFDRWVEHIDAIRQRGLLVDGITGDLKIEVPATSSPSELGLSDICIVQVSSYATQQAADIVKSCMKSSGFCITLQNGVGNIEGLCEVLGKRNVLGGLSYHSAAMIGPGHVRHTHAAETWLGELHGGRTERIEEFKETLAGAGFEPIIVENINSFIWGKFIHNCATNPICAIARLRNGELAQYPAASEFQDHILEEIMAVLSAKGIRVPDPDPVGNIKRSCKGKFNKPSMLQHIEQGKQTEIEALNGVVVSEGKRLGVPTPYNNALVLLLRAANDHAKANADGPVDYDALELKMQRKHDVVAR